MESLRSFSRSLRRGEALTPLRFSSRDDGHGVPAEPHESQCYDPNRNDFNSVLEVGLDLRTTVESIRARGRRARRPDRGAALIFDVKEGQVTRTATSASGARTSAPQTAPRAGHLVPRHSVLTETSPRVGARRNAQDGVTPRRAHDASRSLRCGEGTRPRLASRHNPLLKPPHVRYPPSVLSTAYLENRPMDQFDEGTALILLGERHGTRRFDVTQWINQTPGSERRA